MNHAAVRRIGRSLALVLPVVLVLSGTLAVARVPWSSSSSTQMLTASEHNASTKATGVTGAPGATKAHSRAAHDVLRDRLVAELQEKDPGTALTSLQREVAERPSLARHCASLARALGRAAVQKYGSVQRADRYSRPVCDTSFATGVSQVR